ncbi:MAG: pyridoxamine 5'-phosphate oxidase family protein [Chloroflexota bacterium]
MATFGRFAAAAPEIAAEARRLIYARGDGEALLATVRGDDLPRIHPINVAIVDEGLYAFVIARSPKRLDLEQDGRYALHTHLDPAAPSEVEVRGRARLVDDPTERAAVAAGWAFEVDHSYTLFEFDIESALLGARPTADDWPPRYSSWRADAI